MTVPMAGQLYFHSPCFDGIASAVLTLDYLEERQGWRETTLRPINYDLRATWLSALPEGPSAVVDFLYHPGVAFWADHHPTTFLTDELRAHFVSRRNPLLVYDQHAASCAGLLKRHLGQALGYSNCRFDELVRWAEKTDAARYDSVQEAVFGDAPALRISMGLSVADSASYSVRVVQALRDAPLAAVAEMDEVKRRYEVVRSRVDAGLQRFRSAARLETDEIVVFDVDGSDVTVSRYAPYLFFPEARYSAGIVRGGDGAKVTAMRNPWREFESVPLGPICARLGGGGHHRVGSIALHGEGTADASALLAQLLADLRREEEARVRAPRRELPTS